MLHLPRQTVFAAVLVLLAAGGVFTFSVLTICTAEEVGCKGSRGPVAFDHDFHMAGYDCLACHHVYDREHNNILDPAELYAGNPVIRCAACHDRNADIDRQEAFHEQCIGCHYEDGGPKLCGECHIHEAPSTEFVIILGEHDD